MRQQHWTGEVFADYHQFYLWDGGMNPEAPTDYTDEDVRHRIKTGKHIVVIQPERNFTVPVTIEIHDLEPSYSAEEWDHIAEASLELPTGSLQIHECTGGLVTEFVVTPGSYRVRSFHAKLSTVNSIEGEDTYKIVVWPAPFSPLIIIKQYVGADHAV